MKRTTKYVALDVHRATTSASVREESGRVIARSVLPTDGATITEFVRGMRGAVHVSRKAPRRSGYTTCWRRWWIGSSSAIGGGHRGRGTTPIRSMPTSSPSSSAAAGCARFIMGASTARR